ncbi:MAG: sigma-70 family RNA polymerase sigma factor [Pirellulales bacterium]|nr:sigma-70 family RNA polymerase sigma factor [Pirellulales bacterium]
MLPKQTVKNRDAKHGTSIASSFDPVSPGGRNEAVGKPTDRSGVQADRALVDRCVAGDVKAWEELYAQCHRPLVASIQIMLGPQGHDVNLVDELAARVWYSLVADDGQRLAKYEPKREARLITFIRAVAKDIVGRHFRSERRRLQRERIAAREEPKHRISDQNSSVASLGAFLETLTAREKAFCGDYLLAAHLDASEMGCEQISIENARKLTSRVRRKLRKFVDYESS